MDSSLSLSSWYRGIHCYALYQSWWQTKNSCHFPFFQAVKSGGDNGLGSAIESSGSQLIEVVSWSMICFPSQLFEGFGDVLKLTLEEKSLQHSLACEKFTTEPHLWKAQGSSADQSWCGKTRWKWRTTGLSASEWVHSARESDGWQAGRRGYGHHWSGYELVFFLAIFFLSVLWLTLQTRYHTTFTDHDLSIWRLFIRWWFRGSQLSSDSLFRQEAICTIAHLHMSTIISSDLCWWKMQSLSSC